MGDQWPAAKMQRKPVPKERAEYKHREAEDRRERWPCREESWVADEQCFLGFWRPPWFLMAFQLSGASLVGATVCFLSSSWTAKASLLCYPFPSGELFCIIFLFLVTKRLLTGPFILAEITKFWKMKVRNGRTCDKLLVLTH